MVPESAIFSYDIRRVIRTYVEGITQCFRNATQSKRTLNIGPAFEACRQAMPLQKCSGAPYRNSPSIVTMVVDHRGDNECNEQYI